MMKKFSLVCILLISASLFAFAEDNLDPYYDYGDWYDDYVSTIEKYNEYYNPYVYTADPYADYYDLYDELKSITIENNNILENAFALPLTIENSDKKNEIITDIAVLNSPNNNEILDLLAELQKTRENINIAKKTALTEKKEPKTETDLSVTNEQVIFSPFAEVQVVTLDSVNDTNTTKENTATDVIAEAEVITNEPAVEINNNETPKTEVKADVPPHSFYADGTFGPTIRFLRGTNIAVGGHVATNFFVVPEFSFGPYIHGEYFLAPLGSKSGLLAGLEMELEAGLNLTFPVFRSPHFTIKIGSDIGYYMQWLQYNSDISTEAHLTYNGLLLRPTVTFDFARLCGMPIGIAFFYQVTVMMQYSDYNGFGIMLNL